MTRSNELIYAMYDQGYDEAEVNDFLEGLKSAGYHVVKDVDSDDIPDDHILERLIDLEDRFKMFASSQGANII